MKKGRGNGERDNLGMIALIIGIISLFVLLAVAVLGYYAANNGRFPMVSSWLKYVFLAFIIILPIILLLLIIVYNAYDPMTDVNANDLRVDFGGAEVREKPVKVDGSGAPPNLTFSGAPPQHTNLQAGTPRFYMLSEIDRAYGEYEEPDYDNAVTLKELCEDFRKFSASKLGLYYEIADVRRFIGAMAVTKLIILQGMSGTGKTSLAYAFGEYLENAAVIVPIQPMWKERTDLLGYYNEFTQKYNETTLLTKMYEANKNDEIYVTVLDEMNIARVEYYFAEFLSLLEIPDAEARNIDVVTDRWSDDPELIQADGKLKLPENMWFIGTANNDDSTFSISDKVYDRAMVINLDKKATPFEAEGETRKISASHLKELMERAEKEYALTDRNRRRLKKLDEYMIKTYKVTFGNRIMKQIERYVPVTVACGGSELSALDDILSRKIFRKLEGKNPVYVKQTAEKTCEYLDGLFGEDRLPQCKETLKLIERNN